MSHTSVTTAGGDLRSLYLHFQAAHLGQVGEGRGLHACRTLRE